MKIRPVGSELLQADGQIDGHGVVIFAFTILRRRQKNYKAVVLSPRLSLKSIQRLVHCYYRMVRQTWRFPKRRTEYSITWCCHHQNSPPLALEAGRCWSHCHCYCADWRCQYHCQWPLAVSSRYQAVGGAASEADVSDVSLQPLVRRQGLTTPELSVWEPVQEALEGGQHC